MILASVIRYPEDAPKAADIKKYAVVLNPAKYSAVLSTLCKTELDFSIFYILLIGCAFF